jgi:hypothetical protein
VYEEISLDAAVDRLNDAVTQTIDSTTSFHCESEHGFRSLFSGKLEIYIKGQIYFYIRFKRNKSDYFYIFLICWKLIEVAVTCDRPRSLESTDEKSDNRNTFLNICLNLGNNILISSSFKLLDTPTTCGIADAVPNLFRLYIEIPVLGFSHLLTSA